MAAGEQNKIGKRFLLDFYRFLNDFDRFLLENIDFRMI